ncbi:unnamed protein product [Auanema sp. JU1783]|nr:unnamed protein product [Auanema sp. JU1783]
MTTSPKRIGRKGPVTPPLPPDEDNDATKPATPKRFHLVMDNISSSDSEGECEKEVKPKNVIVEPKISCSDPPPRKQRKVVRSFLHEPGFEKFKQQLSEKSSRKNGPNKTDKIETAAEPVSDDDEQMLDQLRTRISRDALLNPNLFMQRCHEVIRNGDLMGGNLKDDDISNQINVALMLEEELDALIEKKNNLKENLDKMCDEERKLIRELHSELPPFMQDVVRIEGDEITIVDEPSKVHHLMELKMDKDKPNTSIPPPDITKVDVTQITIVEQITKSDIDVSMIPTTIIKETEVFTQPATSLQQTRDYQKVIDYPPPQHGTIPQNTLTNLVPNQAHLPPPPVLQLSQPLQQTVLPSSPQVSVPNITRTVPLQPTSYSLSFPPPFTPAYSTTKPSPQETHQQHIKLQQLQQQTEFQQDQIRKLQEQIHQSQQYGLFPSVPSMISAGSEVPPVNLSMPPPCVPYPMGLEMKPQITYVEEKPKITRTEINDRETIFTISAPAKRNVVVRYDYNIVHQMPPVPQAPNVNVPPPCISGINPFMMSNAIGAEKKDVESTSSPQTFRAVSDAGTSNPQPKPVNDLSKTITNLITKAIKSNNSSPVKENPLPVSNSSASNSPYTNPPSLFQLSFNPPVKLQRTNPLASKPNLPK